MMLANYTSIWYNLTAKTTNGVETKYVYGLGLIGEEKECCFKTYHFDYRGSTVAITDECGNIIDTLKYDTYGNVTEHIGDSYVIFGYNGRDGVITDRNGLLYMRARYYSPAIRRFINADILHGEISDSTSLNRYSYVNGNPVSFVDPFGLVAEERGITLLNAKSNFSPKSEAIDELLSKIKERKNLEAIWNTIEFIESQKANGIHHNLSRYTHWDLGVDTDLDGKIDYYVYNYFYKKTYKNLNATTFDVVSGKVYFYVNVDASFFENPNNKPEGFNCRNDIMIGDFTTSENPTLYAYQAHNINSDVIDSIMDVMMLYDKDFNTAWDRTKDSVIVEWKNHNLYSSFHKSAQDIDFDNAEEGYNSVDYAMKAIKRFLGGLFS